MSTARRCIDETGKVAGREHVLFCSRATLGLVAIFRALDLPPGSEVLLPATLCANPASAIRWAGLTPLVCDISPTSLNLDLESAQKLVGPNTRALLAVPLFGLPFDPAAVERFAAQHNLIVVEDAAHAVGVNYGGGRRSGSVGICSVYSFGRGKIACAGGGAAVLADDPVLLSAVGAELARVQGVPFESDDRLPGALGRLEEELELRRVLAAAYHDRLALPGVAHASERGNMPLWKYSVVLPDRERRDAATRLLLRSGVEATNLYTPLGRFFPSRGACPEAENIAERIINLPLWPQRVGLADEVAVALETVVG